MPTYGIEIELHQISPFEMNLSSWQRGRDCSFDNCAEYRFNGPTSNILGAKLLVSALYNNDNFIKK